jgi:hypothetical protein
MKNQIFTFFLKAASVKNCCIALLFSIAASTELDAQSPQKISYQAVVRNTAGTLVALKPIGMRISILKGSEFGAAIFVETHAPTTNLNALLSIQIGSGTIVLGNLSAIDWSDGPYFLKSEMDPNGGTAYTITGTHQLLSVPYALYSNFAETANSADSSGYATRAGLADSVNATARINLSQIKFGNANANDILRWDGNAWGPSPETNLLPGNGIGINGGKIGTQWNSGLYGPYTDSLQVGIGTNSPYSRLHVSGGGWNVITTNFEGSGWNSFYRYGRYLGYIGVYNDTNALDFGSNGTGTSVNIVTNAQPRISIASGSGYVGIGTTTPTTNLDVNGKTKTTDLQMTNGGGAGKIMTSDASGNASWVTPGKQVVGVYPVNGYLGTGYNSMTSNIYQFMGPTTNITVTSTSDIITGSAMVPIAAASAINNVWFGLGYQLQPSGTVSFFTGGSYSIIQVGTERHPLAAAGSVTGLAPGTYKVGVIIYNTTATAISSNDYVNSYYMLIK